MRVCGQDVKLCHRPCFNCIKASALRSVLEWASLGAQCLPTTWNIVGVALVAFDRESGSELGVYCQTHFQLVLAVSLDLD